MADTLAPPRPAPPAPPGRASGPPSPPSRTRALGWFSAACIGLSILAMMFASAAGPSGAVVTTPRPSVGPPWWVSLHVPVAPLILLLWVGSMIGAVGVAAGLVAVARGARLPIRRLLAAAFISTAVFTVLPAAGSSDTLDYAAYGRMVVLGHDPYQMTPLVFRRTGDPVAATAPRAWQTDHSAYGPLATLEQAAAAELGGTSTARIIFWLKLWNALAFGLVVIVLDRLLRSDPARRARAHLLWSLNPLLLWGLVASGHLDAVAVACGLCGLVLVRAWQRGEAPPALKFLAAGALAGAATDFKITYALFGVGVAWAGRKSLATLAAAIAGALAVLIPSYLYFGRAAITVLANHRDATADTLWRLFGSTFLRPSLPEVALIILPVFAITALLLLRRLPEGLPEFPAILPTFALSLAWMLAWPYQRPWYDAGVICLLVFFRASRLDWVILAQLAVTTSVFMPGMPSFPPRHSQLASLLGDQVNWGVPIVRLAALVAVIALCVTGVWYARRPAAPQLAGVR